MDWHDFKVMTLYAVVACVFLLILGQVGLAITALVGYSLYGFIHCIKKHRKKTKLYKGLDGISEEIKEVLMCHILQRNPRLKKRDITRLVNDITSGDYQIKTFQLTDKISMADENDSDGGMDYYLTFDGTDKYRVNYILYGNVQVGATLYTITTPNDLVKVIKSNKGYLNL